jgi:hypothetical protein
MIAAAVASGEVGGNRKGADADLVRFSKLTNLGQPLSKRLAVTSNGLRVSAAATMFRGLATHSSVHDLAGLASVIEGLTDREALTFGIAQKAYTRIATRMAIVEGRALPGAIYRGREHFAWPNGRAVFMMDVDRPKDGSKPFRAREFDEMLCAILPWWPACARMYKPSASAFVYDATTGDELLGPGSLRCYAIADNGESIPFLGVAVTDALWKAGKGRIEFAKDGHLLVRSPVDGSVWQPERLDFAGPVVLGPGLVRKGHAPWIIDGCDIDTEVAIAAGPGRMTFGVWASSSREVTLAKRVARPETRQRQRAHAEQLAEGSPNPGKAARQHLSAIKDGRLPCSAPIYFADGRTVTVAEILADPVAFHLADCADPAEPEYGNDRRIARLYANATEHCCWPRIFSNAHGGRKYILGIGKKWTSA